VVRVATNLKSVMSALREDRDHKWVGWFSETGLAIVGWAVRTTAETSAYTLYLASRCAAECHKGWDTGEWSQGVVGVNPCNDSAVSGERDWISKAQSHLSVPLVC